MASVIRRAVRQRERPLRRAVAIPYGRATLTLGARASAEIVSAAKRRPGTHNGRRRLLETLLWRHLASQVERRLPEGRAGEHVAPSEVGAELRRRPEVAQLLERMWPRLSPEAFLHDFLGARPLIELASRGILSEDEQGLLYRPRSASHDEAVWTQADIALLDEASSLLGPVRPRADDQRAQRTYGHVVVDEVQDLTPMDLRMVARRSLSGSMTVVGDIAQATGPWAPASWDDVVAQLPARRGWRLAALSVNYRAPVEVMELASRVLAEALPGAAPPEAVRETRLAPQVRSTDPAGGVEEWQALLGRTVSEEIGAVAGAGDAEEGTVGVLVPSRLLGEVEAALRTWRVDYGEVGSGALDTRVSLLALRDAKGLEFDSVVVVEPAQIVAESPQGLRALYVALTRCTNRLAIVHREPLPAPLRSAS
jgi:hypothetical protein